MHIDGETMETMRDFIFLDSKITADGDCNHEIKRRLLLGRKAMTNLDSILKIRDINLPTKLHLVKAMGFSGSSAGKESACNAGDPSLISELGRCPGERIGHPLQDSWAMLFPVVMCGCESWTIKRAESRRTDAFELWCWRRLLSPLDCKEIQPVHPKGDQS